MQSMCSAQKLHTLGREYLGLVPLAFGLGILLGSPPQFRLAALAELDVVGSVLWLFLEDHPSLGPARLIEARSSSHLHQEPDPGPFPTTGLFLLDLALGVVLSTPHEALGTASG
jgi:hypothetical protein